MRPLLKRPFNQASYQTAVLHSLPTSFPLSLYDKAISRGEKFTVMSTILAFGNCLTPQWQQYKNWEGLLPSVHFYDTAVKKMWESNPPISSHAGPQFSSIGRLDSLVPKEIPVYGYGEPRRITLEDFYVSLRLTSPLTFMHAWGLQGKTTIQLMYNEHFWKGNEVLLQGLMEEVDLLIKEFVKEVGAYNTNNMEQRPNIIIEPRP